MLVRATGWEKPMPRKIEYGNLMHDAMRGLIRRVLSDVAETGLPGNHHFFITFDTRHPDSKLADWLRDRYPEEMTVVVQHWFDGLNVTEDGFAITLNFGDNPEPLYIPFDAIRTFVDPSVEFGLRFETQDEEDSDGTDAAEVPDNGADDRSSATEPPVGRADATDADVVSLDKFRK